MAEAAPAAPVAAPPAPPAPKLNPEQVAYQRAMDALEAIPPVAEPVPPPKVDPPPAEPPKEPPAAETPRSREFARRAQQEQAFRRREALAKQQETQLVARQAELDAMQKELSGRMQQLQQRQEAYRTDPMALLKDHGYDYEGVTKYVLEGKLPPEELMTREVTNLRGEISALRAAQQETLEAQKLAQEEVTRQAAEQEKVAAQQARAEAVATVHGEIQAFVAANPDQYELVNAFGKEATALVYRTIQAAYEQKGEEMTYAQGAERVEQYLQGEIDAKVLKTKKYSARDVNQITDEALVKLAEAKGYRLVQAGKPPPARGVAGAPPNPTPTTKKGMTERERLDEAVRMMEEAERAAPGVRR